MLSDMHAQAGCGFVPVIVIVHQSFCVKDVTIHMEEGQDPKEPHFTLEQP